MAEDGRVTVILIDDSTHDVTLRIVTSKGKPVECTLSSADARTMALAILAATAEVQ